MDATIARVIGALRDASRAHLQGLGDYPKSDPFEHGVAVGTYRGLEASLNTIETVLLDIAEEDKRR